MQPETTEEPVTPLIRCPEFEQRLLRFSGPCEERRDDGRDEVLYVLEGHGSVAIGDESYELEPGHAAFVAGFVFHTTRMRCNMRI